MRKYDIVYNKFSDLMEKYDYNNGFYQQHIVDTLNAEFADRMTSNIQLGFALAGLYLFVEKDYGGRHVQYIHAQLAQEKENIPIFSYKHIVPSIVLANITNTPDELSLKNWARAVWVSYANQHDLVRGWVEKILPKDFRKN